MSNALLRPSPAPTWESLGFAGDVRGHLATWFGLHPLTSKTVYVTYDRLDGATTSRPRCPELEAVARFATLVLDEIKALRGRFPTDDALIEEEFAWRDFLLAHPDAEVARVKLTAIVEETRRRNRLGPAIAEAQRIGGEVTKQCNQDLFGFSEGGC